MRLAELGTVYRYEMAGVMHGLMRVRGFTQDDAHLFCRWDPVESEIDRVIGFVLRVLRTSTDSAAHCRRSYLAQAELMRRVLRRHGRRAREQQLHEKETKALTALLGVDAMWQPPPLAKIQLELNDKLAQARAETSKLARTQLVQHLTVVAAADGVVDPVELECMYGIAGKLDVPPIVVDETLPASAAPMD